MGTAYFWGGGIPTPSSMMFTLLDFIFFLQVYIMVNMQADVGDEIIHAYVRLPFDTISVSRMITDIHTKVEGKTITNVHLYYVASLAT